MSCLGCSGPGFAKLIELEESKQRAIKKANEEAKPICVCEEAGEYFESTFEVAITNGYRIIEVLSRLPGAPGHIS